MRGKSNLMRRGGSGGTDGILLGNAFSLCAMISDSISGTRKEHREIMALQIVSQFLLWCVFHRAQRLQQHRAERRRRVPQPCRDEGREEQGSRKGAKLAFIINMVMYAVFSAVIMNFVGVLSCSVIAITTAAALIKSKTESTR